MSDANPRLASRRKVPKLKVHLHTSSSSNPNVPTATHPRHRTDDGPLRHAQIHAHSASALSAGRHGNDSRPLARGAALEGGAVDAVVGALVGAGGTDGLLARGGAGTRAGASAGAGARAAAAAGAGRGGSRAGADRGGDGDGGGGGHGRRCLHRRGRGRGGAAGARGHEDAAWSRAAVGISGRATVVGRGYRSGRSFGNDAERDGEEGRRGRRWSGRVRRGVGEEHST